MPRPKNKSHQQLSATEYYGQYERGAKSRNHEFDLNKTQFVYLVTGNCHYCGCPPIKPFKKKRYDNCLYNGVDRLDNMKGYSWDNCVTCCKTCNLAKHNMPYDEFITYLKHLVRYRMLL